MATQCPPDAPLDAKAKQAFRRRLLAWYSKHARDLPWRRSRDPYRVWVSEVMLQQTTVAAVKPYFERFLAAFPTVEKLAVADEQQVLRLWEGLGYYRRARGLHAAAQQVVGEHDGKFPRDVPTLMTLPGVGRYTAGAIASIAFDVPAPILEANTIRLFARLTGYRENPAKAAVQRLLWATAEALLPRTDAATFNQALMELGSLVCTPIAPQCDRCPVSAQCAAFEQGLQHEIPATAPKVKHTSIREAAVVVRKHSDLLVRQCLEGERWAGLWDFPRYRVAAKSRVTEQLELQQKIHDHLGIDVKVGALLTTMQHGVTRYRITLPCYDAQHAAGRLRSSAAAPARWVTATQLGDLPLSTTGRKIAGLLT